MKKYKNILCLIIALAMILSLISCSNKPAGTTTSQNSSKDDTSSTVSDSTSDGSSSESSDNSSSDILSDVLGNSSLKDWFNSSSKVWREPYKEEVKVKIVDEDGKFDYKLTKWDGPAGYVIVVPDGNSELSKVAANLQNFFLTKYNMQLDVVSDKTFVAAKEILIGNTNRAESKNTLKENEVEVKISNKKLVFAGGHNVTVKTGVERFIRLAPEKGVATTFKVATDFKTTALSGYKYIWGDEFEGDDVDFTKWKLHAVMEGTTKAQLSYDRDVIRVEDGRLKLEARRFYNPDRAGTEYKIPVGVSSQDNMNFTYGYCEIRCRLPMFAGVWPGWWTRSTDVLKGYRSQEFMAEVDMFEIFGTGDVIPGIIKIYPDHTDAYWVTHRPRNVWTYDDTDTAIYEYHTYGWEWTPEKMVMYVDGIAYQTFDLSDNFDDKSDMSGFHDPEYMIFTNHVITDDSWQSGPLLENSHSKLPACFYIDYFRLYQKDGEGEFYTADTPHTYPDRK